MVRSIYLSNLAIQRLGSCGHIHQAFHEFAAMPARNDFSWNILLNACLQSDRIAAAMDTFLRMPHADAVSGTALLRKLARSRGTIDQALAFFDDLPLRDVVSWNCMVGIAAEAEEAQADLVQMLFDRMPQCSLISMNCLLAAFCRRCEEHHAFKFFLAMPGRNLISWTTILGVENHTSVVFDLMPGWNIVTFNAALSGFAAQGHRMYLFFDEIPEKDLVSWTILLKFALEDSDLAKAQEIFARMPGYALVSSTAAILCFPPDEAEEVLESMAMHDCALHAMLRSSLWHK